MQAIFGSPCVCLAVEICESRLLVYVVVPIHISGSSKSGFIVILSVCLPKSIHRDHTMVQGGGAWQHPADNIYIYTQLEKTNVACRSTLSGQVAYTNDEVTIQDADSATVEFDLSSQSVGEDAGTPLVVNVRLNSGPNTLENVTTFNVGVSSLGDTEAGVDFDDASFPKLVTFAGGSGNS